MDYTYQTNGVTINIIVDKERRSMKKKIAIVTGGSSGIGLAIANKLVSSEIDVTIVGRTESTLQKISKGLNKKGTADYIKGDVSHRQEVENVINHVLERKGKIDYLINNAGSSELLTTECSLEEAEKIWGRVLDSNLKSSFLMSIAVAPHLSYEIGRIINISSIGAFTGGSSKGSIAYASAKAGILGLTRALANELIGKGITVNSVAPGFIYPTNFFGKTLPQDVLKNYGKQIPAGRPGKPEEVANAVYFLLSEESSYITGEVLNVNGGWLFGK